MNDQVDLTPHIEDAKKLILFYAQCLTNTPPIASMDTITDSQTGRLLETIFDGRSSPAILDYGCGKLRLLNALLTHYPGIAWTYHGADVEDPRAALGGEIDNLEHFQSAKVQWSLGSIAALRNSTTQYDVVTVVNVFHELPILDMAAMIEDARQHLKPDGVLLIMDTVLLPEGEPRFVPMLPDQVRELFGPEARDLSYVSKRQKIPISFFAIEQRHVRLYHNLSQQISELFQYNRDVWSLMSVQIEHEELGRIKQDMGLLNDGVFTYGYLNTITANANFRLLEYTGSRKQSVNRINSFATQFFDWFERTFQTNGQFPRVQDVYDTFGKTVGYGVIEAVIMRLNGSLIAPIMADGRIQPMEIWDILFDRVGLETIETEGLDAAIAEASFQHSDMYDY